MAKKGTELRVGIFVFSALLIASLLVFLVGSETNLFVPTSDYYALFEGVGGLRAGSPVRVGGVTVGTVDKVDLLDSGKIRVSLHVRDSARHLLREDSEASIASKGLLGDMLVDISVGQGPPLAPGSQIRAQETVGLAQYMERTGKLLEEVEATARHLAVATEPLGDEQFGQDIRTLTRNLAQLSETLVDARGPVHQVLTSETMAATLERTLEDAQRAIASMSRTADDIQAITREVRHGEGLAHALIYDPQGAQLVASLSAAGSEIAAILHDVRTNDSAAHNLLYTDQAGQLIENLTAISADLRHITTSVKDGQGTLGGLLVDPSLYEDMKRLVGNLERNRILRSLVRYSIREGDRSPAHDVEVGRK